MTKCALLCLMLSASPAMAQITFIDPAPNGGFTITQPGAGITFVNPTPGGGYMVIPPPPPLQLQPPPPMMSPQFYQSGPFRRFNIDR